MKKNSNDYFMDSDKLYDFFPDALLTTDEWESLRYKIVQELRNCDDDDKRIDEFYIKRGLPFLSTFQFYLEKKLTEAGYNREHLKIDSWLKTEAYSKRKDYDNPDIEAALAGLVSIRKLKDILIDNGKVDKRSIKVFLYSLEMIINLLRAGVTPKFARTQVKTILGGEKGGKKSGKVRFKRSTNNKQIWQQEAEKIWKKHSMLSKAGTARLIYENLGGNIDTIRRSIKKSLP